MKQFLELFNPLPGNSYLLVSTKIDKIADELYTKIKSVDGELKIALYGDDDFPNATKLQHIDSLDKPFKAKPRDNDIVIFKDIFYLHANKEMLLKIAYQTLANAAEIIIAEKKSLLDIEKTLQLLEKNEYRAANHIGDILEGYDIFVAKKMHMWGNGL